MSSCLRFDIIIALDDDELLALIPHLSGVIDKKSNGKVKIKDMIGLDPVNALRLECKHCGEVWTITMQEYELLPEIKCPKCTQ